MKKLLMISTDQKIFEEGSAVRARQIGYAREWDEVHIIVFQTKRRKDGKGGNDPAREDVIAPNCWAYPTDSRSRLAYPFDAIRLGRFLIERRGITDITCQDPFMTAMAGVSLKKQFPHARLEIQIHTDVGSPKFTYTIGHRIRKLMAAIYLPRADHIRTVSQKAADYALSLGIDRAKIDVRPIGVDIEKIKSAQIIGTADLRRKYPRFERIVLVASRLEKEKNVSLAIDAWKKVTEKIPKAGLVIVGAGSQSPQLRAKTERDASVVYEGWVDPETLYSYYKTCDVFLNTSLFEGYGMTLVEARAAGCTIVSTDVGVARETGARIVAWDAESVAEGVIEALT